MPAVRAVSTGWSTSVTSAPSARRPDPSDCSNSTRAAMKSRPTCSNCRVLPSTVPVSFVSSSIAVNTPYRRAPFCPVTFAAPRSSLGWFDSMLLNSTPSRFRGFGGAPILRVLMSVVGEPPPPPGPHLGFARGDVEKISCPSKKNGLFSEKNVS